MGKHFKMTCWRCGGEEWSRRVSPTFGCRTCAPAKGSKEYEFLKEGVGRGIEGSNLKHHALYEQARTAFLAANAERERTEAEAAAKRAARKVERKAELDGIAARREARLARAKAEQEARLARERAYTAKAEARVQALMAREAKRQVKAEEADAKRQVKEAKRQVKEAAKEAVQENKDLKLIARAISKPQNEPVTRGIPSPDEAGVKIDRLYAEMRFLDAVDAALAAFPKAPRCTCCPELKKLTETEDGKLFCPVCAYGVLRSGYCTFHSTEHYPDLAASAPRVPLYTFPRELLGGVDPERFRPRTSGTAEAVFDP